MKSRKWKKNSARMLAGVLTVGMMTTQPAAVFAAGGQTAVNQSGHWVTVSEPVMEMLSSGTVYQDRGSGYLYDKATGQRVDPISGAKFTEPSSVPESPSVSGTPERPESPDSPVQSDPPDNPDTPDHSGTPEIPDTPVNPDEPGAPDTPVNPDIPDTPGTPDPDHPNTPDGSDTPDDPGTPDGSDTPDDPDIPDGSDTPDHPDMPDTPEHPDTPGQNEPEQPDIPGNSGGPATPELPSVPLPDAVPEQAAGSNAHLIAKQQLVRLPVILQDFRFWTVARKYAFAREEITVREEKKDEARAVGRLDKEGLCYILKEEEGWLYVESGTVRGFVKPEEVFSGEEAQAILETFQEKARKKAEAEHAEYRGIEGIVTFAKELVPQASNKAFLYTRSTVNRTVVDKDYAVVTAGRLNVREGKGTGSRVVGRLEKNSLCYILADKDEEWIYIESGDVRGFVNRDYIRFNEETTQYVEFVGEKAFPQAEKLIEPKENAACYYTLTSIKSGVPGGEVRTSLLEFASQFIGNPYVWGGTSLTDGADCSGFVQSVYKQYGYDLPRVSRDQSQYGTKIPVEDARPGDLVFYARNGQVYHVVIYAGEGRTIEAMGTEYGIVQGNLYTKDAVWATRVLDDSRYGYGSSDIMEVNATPDMYGTSLGTFKLTYYCPCELCCDVETGITATGTPVVEGQTIAVDPKIIPYGTKVIIGGHIFTAEDCGGAIKQNRIDIYVNDHQRANDLGVNYADVFLLK